jgi:Tol biopolymer transport system component
VLRDTPVIWTWGPDSRSITSMTFDFSGEPTTYGIVDIAVDSGEVRRTLLEPSESLCPSAFAWSPDARQFVFASGVYRQGCGDPDLFGLWLVDPAGGGPRRLTSGALTILPRWTADGRIVARRIGGFDVADPAAGPGPDSIVLIGTDGSERVIAPVERALFPSWPYLEVAGGVAAFGSAGCARGSVSSVDLAGGGPRRLSDQSVATLTPALAPDGRAVAWVAEHAGGADLVLAATDGSGERALLTGALPIDLTGWSGDGRWLSFTVREGPLTLEECPD